MCSFKKFHPHYAHISQLMSIPTHPPHRHLVKSLVTIYSYTMTTSDKLLAKAIKNPGSLSFKDFETLLVQQGWVKRRQKGSHAFWAAFNGDFVCIQNEKGKAKEYQVKQFLKALTGNMEE